MIDTLTKLPGYALRRAAAAMMAELSEQLAPIGVRYTDVAALILVSENPAITPSRLGRILDIQRANMVPFVGRLESFDWVVRRALNKKSHGLHLTPDGKAKLDQAYAVICAFEAKLIARVPKEHRAHLLPALNALWQ